MNARLVIGVLLALLFGLIGGWYAHKAAAIDACLDAGGKWIYTGEHCTGALFGEQEAQTKPNRARSLASFPGIASPASSPSARSRGALVSSR
jgi:hypothetical protein